MNGRRHPALGRRWVDHSGTRWPVRRVWPAGDHTIALELAAAGGAAVGATVDGDGRFRLLDVDTALPSLTSWRERVDATVVAHRPGRRAVVRVAHRGGYHFVKLAKPRTTARALQRLATVELLTKQLPDAPAMAPILDADAEAGELVLGALPGPSLGQVVASGDVDQARVVGVAIGRAVAVIASADPGDLVEHTVDDEITTLGRWVDDAICYGAVTGRAAERLHRRRDLATVELLRFAGRAAGPPTLLHRDLHDGQVLADDHGSIGVLDWDTASAGSSALDLANLLTHLDRLAADHPATAEAARHGLVASARDAGHPSFSRDPAELEAWRATAAVRLDAVHAFRN